MTNMTLPKRKNHRLQGYDYAQCGCYFVTICTHNRKRLLCDIVGSDALVAPTSIGKKVIECWNNIAALNSNVILDKFVLMPNHIHGILILQNPDETPDNTKQYDFQLTERRGRRSLPGLIKDFKSVTTRHFKRMYGASTPLWQTSFYDTVIRSDRMYQDIWQYIDENPLKWQLDEYYKAP